MSKLLINILDDGSNKPSIFHQTNFNIMNTASKKFDTPRKAKNAFNKMVDYIPQNGTIAPVKSFATAELKGDIIEIKTTYYSTSTIIDFLDLKF